MYYSMLLAVLCLSGFDMSPRAQAALWRAFPVCPSKLQAKVGRMELFWLNLTTFGLATAGTQQPRYDLGSPELIFVIDFDNKFVVHALHFMKRAINFKIGLGPFELDAFDSELVELIRQTTGLPHPKCYFAPHWYDFEAFVFDNFILCLSADATLTYRSKQDSQVVTALQRPFIFVSSRVTDEMLIRALSDVTWERVFFKLGKRYEGGIEYDADTVNTYRKAFNKWQHHACKSFQLCKRDDADIILCIA